MKHLTQTQTNIVKLLVVNLGWDIQEAYDAMDDDFWQEDIFVIVAGEFYKMYGYRLNDDDFTPPLLGMKETIFFLEGENWLVNNDLLCALWKEYSEQRREAVLNSTTDAIRDHFTGNTSRSD